MTRSVRRHKRGFAQVQQQRSGHFSVRYTTPTGARVSAGKTFKSKADAEAWAADRRRDIDRGNIGQPARITFAAYAQNWLPHRQVAGRPLKPRTREHYQDILDQHLLEAFGNRQLGAITPADVRDWYADTLTDKPTMRSHAYSLLRTILNTAVNDDLIDVNPCRITGAGRSKRVHKIQPATIPELTVLTQAMPEPLQLMVTLAAWCALRFGESVELRRGDIDLSQEVIRIRRAAVRTKNGYTITSPKSDAGVRDVSIPPHIMPLIEAHLAKHVDADRDSLIFPAANFCNNVTKTSHLQPSTLSRHWYKARHAAGRDDLRWHDLRHSSLVLAAATGATLAELMARAGHSSAQAALRYQHAAQGRDREIAALLSKLADG